jgi:outer membrane protein assembly factor BamB
MRYTVRAVQNRTNSHGIDALRTFGFATLLLTSLRLPLLAEDWSRFRGANGSGVAEAARLPVKFGGDMNLVWKTALPSGHSSPVIVKNRVFLTGFEDTDLLVVLAFDVATGRPLWRKQVVRTRAASMANPYNNPASPSPVTDGESVYAFFQDFGLIAYSIDGAEQWSLKLGPFRNNHGMGASPIIYKDLLIQICDQDVARTSCLSTSAQGKYAAASTARNYSASVTRLPQSLSRLAGRRSSLFPAHFR